MNEILTTAFRGAGRPEVGSTAQIIGLVVTGAALAGVDAALWRLRRGYRVAACVRFESPVPGPAGTCHLRNERAILVHPDG